MQGIQFVLNDKGERVAVQIDLKKHGGLWEDFYDGLIASKRTKEPKFSLAQVKSDLKKRRK